VGGGGDHRPLGIHEKGDVMNVVAATVTVYFIGLVNFQDVEEGGRKVILPLANVARTHKTETLKPHVASIEITDITKAQCSNFGSKKWTAASPGDPATTPPTPPTPSICLVTPLSGVAITLPATGTTFSTTTEFDKIPKLQSLCGAITGMKPEFDLPANYAAKLTLTSGQLDAYRAESAWVSRIELTSSPAVLTLDDKSVELPDGAIVRLRNEPVPGGSAGTDQQHFWWYYVMSENGTDCVGIPDAASSAHAHSAPRGRRGHPDDSPAVSSPGCSNTNFP
jgi:hypothetical protein